MGGEHSGASQADNNERIARWSQRRQERKARIQQQDRLSATSALSTDLRAADLGFAAASVGVPKEEEEEEVMFDLFNTKEKLSTIISDGNSDNDSVCSFHAGSVC